MKSGEGRLRSTIYRRMNPGANGPSMSWIPLVTHFLLLVLYTRFKESRMSVGAFTEKNINFGLAGVEQAKNMKLGSNVMETIERAHPYPEGLWLFIPVGPTDDIHDIHQLLVLRVKTKRL
jgi:hypothetical protein